MNELKPEVVDAFVDAVVRVIRASLGEEAEKIATSYASELDPPPSIAVSILLTGKLQGPVTWSFSRPLAKQVTQSMLMGAASEEHYAEAVAELANMMLGSAAGALEDAGYLVGLTPPSLSPVRPHDAPKVLVVAITLPSGELKLMFDLQEAA